jgi:hypothetical protein
LSPGRLLDIGSASGPDYLVVRLCCFVDLGMAAEQLHALAIAATFAGSDPARAPRGVVARRRERAVQGRVGLLPLPAADRVSWRGDLRTQAARVPADQGRGRRPSSGQGAAAGHEEPERSQAAALEAGASDREAQLRWPKADEPLFPIVHARKTLSWINEEAGTKVQGHGLRATFASIAEELVSSALVKRMMNHAVAGDVTLGHYVAKSKAQLRAG